MILDNEELRKSYYNELQGYKSAQMNKLTHENRLMTQQQDEVISVSVFNQLQGIDSATLQIVNNKISEIKEVA